MSMMRTYPRWSDNVTVLAPTALTTGNTTRAQIDLRTSVGALITAYVSKGGTVQPSAAITVRVRKLAGAGAAGIVGGRVLTTLQTFTALRTGTVASTIVNKDIAAGASTVLLATANAFTVGDMVSITDASFARYECARIVRKIVTGSSGLVLDRPLAFAHTSTQADKVRALAESFTLWVDGGAMTEVHWDYGAATAGAAQHVSAKANRYVDDYVVW